MKLLVTRAYSSAPRVPKQDDPFTAVWNLISFPALLIGILSFTTTATASPFTFTSFNCLCVAVGINDSAQVVGIVGQTTGNPAFFWNGAAFQTIVPPAGWSDISPGGINNAGQIVGSYYGSNTGHGFLDSAGGFTTLDYPGATSTGASDIDNFGHIIGGFDSGSGAFALSGGTYSTINGISGLGDAVGTNDLGWIVGSYQAQHALLLVGNNLTVFDYPGATRTTATGVDNLGDIVGYYDDSTGRHGFLKIGNTFTPIDYPGASETDIYGINNAGQLVGTGWVGTFPDYVAHGFVANFTTQTPVPEPSAWWLAIGGAVFLISRRRSHRFTGRPAPR